MVERRWVLGLAILSTLAGRATGKKGEEVCLSWRVEVETNNLREWRIVPRRCVGYVANYMMKGQYGREMESVVEQIFLYVETIDVAADGRDAWVFDVDDTCLSNLGFYRGRSFGGEPFDARDFEMWAKRKSGKSIPPVQRLVKDLGGRGFKVFLITGRDSDSLRTPTSENLRSQGFVAYERLIMRGAEDRGKSAAVFKTEARAKLVLEGYRIRGNVGDQWTDLSGDHPGDRTFKLPNPMYFVP